MNTTTIKRGRPRKYDDDKGYDGIIYCPGDRVRLNQHAWRTPRDMERLGLGSNPLLTVGDKDPAARACYFIREFTGTGLANRSIHRFFLEIVSRAKCQKPQVTATA